MSNRVFSLVLSVAREVFVEAQGVSRHDVYKRLLNSFSFKGLTVFLINE